MRTSIGYHTFTIGRRFTQEHADNVWKAFKKYRNATGEIEIIKREPYSKDPSGRHYSVVYPRQYKGISWDMRFSNRGFYVNGEYTPCSIKATINPKILTGEKNYIQAANASYFEEVERIFNEEAAKISPLLGQFHQYSLNQFDYCINFDISELNVNLPPHLKEEFPKMLMRLIQHGDIPEHYHREDYKEEYESYLKSKSVVVNCYWKHADLKKNFSDCPDLEKSQDIIRFEVQYRYPKAYAAVSKIKKKNESQRSILKDKLEKAGYYNFPEADMDDLRSEQSHEMFREASSIDTTATILKSMSSDENCSDTIDKYFNDVIKPGDYYTFANAKRNIEAKVHSWEKTVRLITALKLIRDCEGIAKAKASLSR